MIYGKAPTAKESRGARRLPDDGQRSQGMNASTFAARVVASTQADLFMATTAAYCALTGPLHGGAPEPVLEMLGAIGTRERIQPWIDNALARGERLMGFGHRVYRVRDPRADVLKGAVERLALNTTDLPFAAEVEAYSREALRKKNPERALDTNVEFFTAILLDALKIPRQAFTPIFATGRSWPGWTAHAREQQRPRPPAASGFDLHGRDAGLTPPLSHTCKTVIPAKRTPHLLREAARAGTNPSARVASSRKCSVAPTRWPDRSRRSVPLRSTTAGMTTQRVLIARAGDQLRRQVCAYRG